MYRDFVINPHTERAESFGFKASTSFEDGIIKTIEWYLEK